MFTQPSHGRRRFFGMAALSLAAAWIATRESGASVDHRRTIPGIRREGPGVPRQSDGLAQFGAPDRRPTCGAKSCSSTSGPTPASTGCARCRTFARGPHSTKTRAWLSLACTRPNSHLRKTSTTFDEFAKEMGIEYPVAIDNDRAIWRGFANHYWPALYFLDAAGHVRDHHFGEGKYEQSETTIRQLLADAGNRSDRAASSRRGAWSRSRRGLGQLESRPRPTSAIRKRRELCVSRWCGGEHASDYAAPSASPPESLGPFRTMDGQEQKPRC